MQYTALNIFTNLCNDQNLPNCVHSPVCEVRISGSVEIFQIRAGNGVYTAIAIDATRASRVGTA